MERVNRRRNPVRKQFDRLVKEVDEALAKDEIDLAVLRISFEILDNTVAQLNDLDSQARELLFEGESTEDNVDREFFEVEKYQRSYLRVRAAKLDLEGRVEINQSSTEQLSINGETKRRKYLLPEIKLRTFGGQLKDWLSWWSQFEKIHLDEEVHTTDKFHYLCQSMESGSEAAALINSYPQTEGNYDKAVLALRERFGRSDLLLQVYVRELLSLVISNVTTVEKMPLAKLYVSLESHLRSLTALNLDKADPATWLFPLVESSLAEETLRAWQRSTLSKADGSMLDPPKSRLEFLMEFIKLEVQSEQQITLAQQGFQTSANTTVIRKNVRKTKATTDDIPTVAGLVAQHLPNCHLCGKSHATHSCVTTRMKPMEERFKLIRERKLCFRCLRPGHMKSACKKGIKCFGCGGKNHSLVICLKSNSDSRNKDDGKNDEVSRKRQRTENEPAPVANKKATTSIQQTSNQCSQTVMLNTIRAFVRSKSGEQVPVRILGDSGCQRSYATSSIIDASVTKFIENEWLQNIVFGGSATPPTKVPKHKMEIYGSNGSIMNFQLLVRSQLTGDIQEIPPGNWLHEFEEKGIKFSDVGNSSSQVDIVIGNDYWGRIRTGNMVKSTTGLIAEETIFGWTVGGQMVNSFDNGVISNLMCTQNVENLWSLETLGIRDPHEKSKTEEDIEAWEHFKDNVSRDESGMYVVALPWNVNKASLPTNKKTAVQRLQTTTNKLKREGKIKIYNDVFEQWKNEGLIFQVSATDEGHFIPHRPVFKESTTTPVRPVYDASCRVGRYPCLNECIHKGPNLIELIPKIMLRFGMEKIGVSADIRKAFQMLKVCSEDQKYQKFLWWKDEKCDEIIVYQHDRVVFGISCSPFLLGVTINHHLDSWSNTNVATKLKESFYVDNLLTSVTSTNELQVFKQEAEKTMKNAQMDLRQWVWTSMSPSATDKQNPAVIPVLGLEWDYQEDTLRCCVKPVKIVGKITKRNILSTVASVFDPMGYLCPAMVFPKMLLQEIWAFKTGWDDEVPVEVQKKFITWTTGLECLSKVKIPRNSQIDNAASKEVHVFCDSSKEAMAAVAFLRTELFEAVKVQFLFGKSRVTPYKKLTIPRAELTSCVIGSRIGKLIVDAGYKDVSMFYWSDSSTALAWIKRTGDWGVFVTNRVKEIVNTTNPKHWRHVPGDKNPADLPSRGCSPLSLVNSRWWEGPSWLRECKEKFPIEDMAIDEEKIKAEVKKSIAMSLLPVPVKPFFSRYWKNVEVWAWILRFVNNARKITCKSSSRISIGEMRDAEKLVLRQIQKESFQPGTKEIGGILLEISEDGLLKVKTRLNYREDKSSFIYPVVLPNSHPMVDLLIEDLHRYHGHGGIQFVIGKLREKYWILQTRKAVRRVIKRCVVCKRHSEKRIEVSPAPLPPQRVSTGPVFTTVGVDLAGPLFLKDKQKVWVVLYTCAVYRAIHLDLVSSLSTEAFVKSLERFIGVHGRPNTLWTDNGTNFVGAASLFKTVNWKEISTISNVKQIQWVFNPPTASWWGGFFERLVRSVKDQLRRMIGRSRLNYDELLTCLAGVTSTINERPLTVVTEDNGDLLPLTPSMFIRGREVGQFPELDGMQQLSEGYRRMKAEQKRLQERFRKEYLALLVTRGGKKTDFQLAVGDVVLVGSENKKRFEWPLGKVEELIAGKDGVHRVAKVKTRFGVWTRPLQRLYPLEVASTQVDSKVKKTPEVPVDGNEAIDGNPTRSGRISRKPARYGQWFHMC